MMLFTACVEGMKYYLGCVLYEVSVLVCVCKLNGLDVYHQYFLWKFHHYVKDGEHVEVDVCVIYWGSVCVCVCESLWVPVCEWCL